jgi:polysaccharide biosynthesis protein PslH
MKILQLCKKFPYPLKDGEAIAVTYLAHALADLGHEVTLLSMNTSKHWFDLEHLPADYNHYQAIHTVFVDNRIRPLPALLNLFGSSSYHIERFDNAAFAEKLAELLQNEHFDVVQLESVYLAPYIPVIRRHSQARVALRSHNVEYEIWERVAQTGSPFQRWYLGKITPRLRAYELARLNDYDFVSAITTRDLEQYRKLGLRKPAGVTPIGLDTRKYQPDFRSYKRPLSLSFIGSLDWIPNQEGLRWFLDQVWTPLLAPAFPELEFHIAGRTAPAWLRNLSVERVVFHGEVPDSAAFLNQHSIMVTPLLAGGGMRAKILEAMALGKVTISTSIGLEGISATHGRECFVADTPEQFLDAVRQATDKRAALEQMGHNALAFCQEHFDHHAVAGRLADAYGELKTFSGKNSNAECGVRNAE